MDVPSAVELAATKLTPPALPPSLVHRGGLEARLAEAIDDPGQRVALVSAPAGSGKSTLLAAALAGRSAETAWFQVEVSDNDPARFWSYVLAALGRVRPEVEAALRPSIGAAVGDPEVIVTRLVNHLAADPGPTVLVVDDYHLIDNQDIHAGMERLVELAPQALTIVIACRVDPPLRLGRLRVRGHLTEVRAEDLRFAGADASSLLGPAADRLTADQLAGLCARTEGWAAGLVLAGMSLAASTDAATFVSAFQGNDRLVADYLTEEFLAGLSADDLDRFLRTSILARLTGPLVDAVCGTTDGGAWLREVAARNQMVIGLDRTGTWFRYHHLLADVLRLEAGDRLATELPVLHERAAAWHIEHGSTHEAVEHSLAAGDLATAADLISDNAAQLLNGGQLRTVAEQLDRLGPYADDHVGALVVNGWIAQSTGRIAEAQRYADRARRLDTGGRETGLIVALGVMTSLARGDVAGALAQAETAPEPTESTQAMSLGAVRIWAGQFDRARPFIALAEELLVTHPHDFVASVTPAFDAIAHLEAGDLAGAAERARRAIDTAADRGMADLPQMAMAHGVVARTAAEPEEITSAAHRAVALARRSPETIMVAYALAGAGDALSAIGETEGPALLREARVAVDRCVDPGIAGSALSRAEARHGVVRAVPATPALVEELTEREFAVLRYLPSSLSQRDIAAELFVSLNTVKTHCRAIYRKLGVGDRAAAVQAARTLDLL